MYKILLLLAGGGIGTVARYVVSDYTHKYYLGSFPLGTLAVNMLGSLIIGILWGLFEPENMSHGLRAFLFIGILGGFTTFSSYALESYNMIRDGDIKMAMLNVMANNVLAIGMVLIGLMITSSLQKL
ncbi:MAG TPA: fluoride efflux transporter CrcB [Bacteroidales bacterium]|nr:fluoride efflux transporter CrcB [Bacteroidales bacterium]